ncbi:hypothetical protein B7R25_06380 [Subtercola boreus]|uniref:Uncharacterized protein n=1 Tax=Subtercola boreus TaxID=120213 RepID=A0A3E0WD52_9MICO|nr:hypothetical protein [Subtercola boreus]RFA21018.1 hypothetical protein B7R24_06310 [Subtercola boreus]RFA21402.1 hypothetical protein B7R23_06255 [Subtercola boreus]RFA27373.1 hypothetical protein B7R25_06380 [Subtercola boreus]
MSGTLIQHENKHGERCEGTGRAPVVAAPRVSAASGSKAPARARASAASTGSSGAGEAYKPSTGTSVTGAPPAAAGSAARTAPAARRGVTVRKVEVDPEWLAAREAKQARLRDERDARARARNEIYSTGLDEEPAHVAEQTPDIPQADGEK